MKCAGGCCGLSKGLSSLAALAVAGLGGYNFLSTGCPLGSCSAPEFSEAAAAKAAPASTLVCPVTGATTTAPEDAAHAHLKAAPAGPDAPAPAKP